jgi:hypothetical protein
MKSLNELKHVFFTKQVMLIQFRGVLVNKKGRIEIYNVDLRLLLRANITLRWILF